MRKTNAPKSWKQFIIRSGCILPDNTRSYEFSDRFNIVDIGSGMLQAKRVASKIAKSDKSNAPLRVFVEMEEMENDNG